MTRCTDTFVENGLYPFLCLLFWSAIMYTNVPARYKEWYSALEDNPWVLMLTNLSEPALDMLMLLSGFLAARTLLPLIARAPFTLPVNLLLHNLNFMNPAQENACSVLGFFVGKCKLPTEIVSVNYFASAGPVLSGFAIPSQPIEF